MDRSSVTCVCWVPCGKTKMLQEAPNFQSCRKLAKEMQQVHHMNELQDHNDFIQEDSSTEGTLDSNLQQKSLQETQNPLPNVSFNKEDISFPGQQFFGTLETELPFILKKDEYLNMDLKDSEDEAENEANIIRDTDYVLLAVSADENIPTIEVYVYDEENGALYVHHDLMISHPSLCLEWIDTIGSNKGNYCAVGSYGSSTIDLWNLNDEDEQEPVHSLQNNPEVKDSHTNGTDDAHSYDVLCLHRNQRHSRVLASGSADNVVKVWDLEKLTCSSMYTFHKNKVQAIQWHCVESPILLTTSYDKTACIVDVRDSSFSLKTVFSYDPESICWNRHSPYTFWVSLEDGSIILNDMRKLSHKGSATYLWSTKAHTQACTGITDCSVSGMILTCSIDGVAKVWNAEDASQPALIHEKHLKAGPLFSVSANQNKSTLFSFGGNVVVIWDVADVARITENFYLSQVQS